MSLEWWQNEPNGPDPVEISRRQLGAVGADTWQILATVPGVTSTFTDNTTEAGVAYEYQVYRAPRYLAGDAIDEAGGYWATGVEAPLAFQNSPGIALLVVAETLTPSLNGELQRLEMDLVGDGWTVVRHDVPRHDNVNSGKAEALRAWVQAEYAKNPTVQHALLLVGRVPYVLSGWDAPDGHDRVPHATDLFYADVDGYWTDTVNRDSSGNPAGDGKYDNSHVPSNVPGMSIYSRNAANRIEMWVGRVDLAGMGGFPQGEVELTRNYLAKHHAYRQVLYTHPTRSYWDNLAYDRSPAERYGAVNISGLGNTTKSEHLTGGSESPALWGIDFSDWNGSNYDRYDIKSVFSINFGSHKQKWHQNNNAMRAMLAQPWYVLTCGWGVRPNWYIHHMAMGRPIGYSHFRVANNGYNDAIILDYTEHDDYSNQYRNAVWINLMGDPTLRAFVPEPPANLTAVAGTGEVNLSWTASPADNVDGYRVYRSVDRLGPYTEINPDSLVAGTTFVDDSPVNNAFYMVRAQRLEDVNAGSFVNLSQGALTQAGNNPPTATNQNLSTSAGVPLNVTLGGTDPDAGDELTISMGSQGENGIVRAEGAQAVYTPDAGFYGTDSFTFSVFDGVSTTKGIIMVEVLEPNTPPTIVHSSDALEGEVDQSLDISVEVEGGFPMTYQWFRDGTPVGNAGTVTSTDSPVIELTLLAAEVSDSGDYHVEISNPFGSTSNASSKIAVRVFELTAGEALILHYRLDEGSGTIINDLSPSGNDHTTAAANAIWVADGKQGGAYGPGSSGNNFASFYPVDGDDLNFDPTAEPFSISTWVRTTSTDTFRGVFSKISSNPTIRHLQVWLTSETEIQAYVGDASLELETNDSVPINDGDWHLITIVNFYDHTDEEWKFRIFYDDGTEFVEGTSGSGTNNEPLRIGAPFRWGGDMDEFRIYRKALSPGEVAQLYNTSMPPTPTYSEWADAIDWGGLDSSPEGDANSNGLTNETEFRLGRDGVSPGAQLFSSQEVVTEQGIDYYVLEYRRRPTAPTMRMMVSDDLETWQRLFLDGTQMTEEILDPDPHGDGSAEDVRMKIRRDAAGHKFFVRFVTP